MGLNLNLVGRVSKRGLFGGAPQPAELLRRIRDWLADHRQLLQPEFRSWCDEGEGHKLTARLHPAADPVLFVAPAPGVVRVSAKTSTAGPGYHLFLCDLLHVAEEAFRLRWDPPDPERGIGDEAGYFESGRKTEPYVEVLRWLERLARDVLKVVEETEASDLAINLEVGHRYRHDGILATPLGPRDLHWLHRVAERPEEGRDIFPWWYEGLDARMWLGRALARMWTDVRWRAPITSGERRKNTEAVGLLEQAYGANPALDYPWREWAELYAWTEGSRKAEVEARAAALTAPARIGYRRRDVTVDLPSGWSIRVPGSFAEEVLEDGLWSARDAVREIGLQSATISNRSVPPLDPQDILDRLAPGETGLPELRTRRVTGRGSLTRHDSGDRPYWELKTTNAAQGRAAIVTVIYEDPADRDWAMDVWRSVDFRPS